ncbi:winged helix-turn-helix transcriptional regulator [Rhizobium wenxiniae]|uniref:ArsR/SmtB family transcription factor n=1 Tax=Rhizobium wenxiniae TaxID=1737357 RepID=UPI001C6ED5B3|nr:metalloregulator ArsR/SmtB family transcription factor [Rhizobium wenxiniae]MBW9091557.1 winged helix-turn-helix transcriptional regulator [Rhizobium wenxiniae]
MREFTFDQASASAFLDNLASPVRLEILRMLTEGEKAVTKIAVSLNMSQSAISQHLRKLRDGGVVQTRRDAQMIFYSLPEESSIPTFLAVLDEAMKSSADMSAPLHQVAA